MPETPIQNVLPMIHSVKTTTIETVDGLDHPAANETGQRTPTTQVQQDAELIEQVLNKKPQLYAGLVNRYSKRLYTHLAKLVPNRHDVEELTQEVFIQAFQSLQQFQTNRSFLPWLLQIANRTAYRYYRQSHQARAIPPELSDSLEDLQQDNPEKLPSLPDFSLDNLAQQELLLKALQELPFQARQVLLLRYGESLSYQDIADVLEIPLNTVKIRLNRSKTALKKHLLETSTVQPSYDTLLKG